MKELKSKLTGKVSVYSDEEYAQMVNSGNIDMKKFIVTDLRMRPLIPSLKQVPVEIKKIKPKKE
jgi:hypothetical protein